MTSPTKTTMNPHSLSQKELEVAAALWLSVRGGEPAIDWDKFIKNTAYKNVHSATVSVGPIRKKLQAICNNGEPPASSPAKPRKKAPSKRKAAASDADSAQEVHSSILDSPSFGRGKKCKTEPADDDAQIALDQGI